MWNLEPPAITLPPAGLTRSGIVAWARAQEAIISAWSPAIRKSISGDYTDARNTISDNVRARRDFITDTKVAYLKTLRGG